MQMMLVPVVPLALVPYLHTEQLSTLQAGPPLQLPLMGRLPLSQVTHCVGVVALTSKQLGTLILVHALPLR